jgi:general secretion pathway protein G
MRLNPARKHLRRHGARSMKGMTLIEIMVVLTLLGVVMTVLAVNVIGRLEEGKVDATLLQMKNIETALLNFKVKYHRYPSTSEGLNSLTNPPPLKSGRTPGAFLDNDNLLMDPWGQPLQYYSPATSGNHDYEIISTGSDSAPGGTATAQDISNWEG